MILKGSYRGKWYLNLFLDAKTSHSYVVNAMNIEASDNYTVCKLCVRWAMFTIQQRRVLAGRGGERRGEAGEGAHGLYSTLHILGAVTPKNLVFKHRLWQKKNVANLQAMLILVLFIYCAKYVGCNNTYIFLEFYLYFQHIGIAKRSASLHSSFFSQKVEMITKKEIKGNKEN